MPGGDSIDKIIDVEGFSKDLNTVIGGITQLESKIEEANTKQITIGIDAKGVENVNALNAALAEQKQLISDLGQVQQGNKQVMAEMNTVTASYNVSVTKQAEVIATSRVELDRVNNSLADATAKFKAGGANAEAYYQKMIKLTEQQQKIRGEINNATASIRTQIKATDEFGISIGKTTINLTSLSTQIGRSILRATAYGVVMGGLVAAIDLLADAFTKLSDAEKITDENLKTYRDNLQKFKKENEGLNLKISQDTEKQAELDNMYIRIVENKKSSINAVVNAYEKLHAAHSDIIVPLTEEQKQNHAAIKLNDEQAASIRKVVEARRLQKSVENRTEVIGAAIDVQKEAQNKISLLNKYMTPARQDEIWRMGNMKGSELLKSTEGDVIDARGFTRLQKGDKREYGDHVNITTFAKTYIGLQNEMRAALNKRVDLEKKNQADEQAYMDLTHLPEDKKTPKPKKPKADNAKGMDAELALAKAQYDEELQLNKQKFENSKQTYADEQNLSRENNVAAYKYGENQINIITAWHGKTGELEKKYLARIEEAHAAIQKEDNKASEEQKAIYDKMVKDYEEFRDKLLKLQELNNELEQIKAGAKASHDRASGAGGFLAGLGFDTDFADSQAAKQREIDKAQKDLADLVARRDEEQRTHGSSAQLDTYDMVDIPGAHNKIADLSADKEKERNELIFNTKKQIAEKTIELARQTAQALKTIEDNRFAAEEQQLQIKMRQVELRSQQEMQAIDASAGFEIQKDNLKSKAAAQAAAEENLIQQKQNALALKKAISDKQMAEASILASTAEAEIAAIANAIKIGGPTGLALGLAEAAVIAGIGAAQYAAAASAPLPQFAEGGITTTPYFIAGEAGPEIVAAPGKAPYITDGAKIHHEPVGTEVIPLHKMYEYAVSNITNNKSYSPELQQAYNNEVIMKEVAKIIGDKFADVGGDIERAVYRSRVNIPDAGKSYETAVREQMKLKNI